MFLLVGLPKALLLTMMLSTTMMMMRVRLGLRKR